jgi:tetratricopeptide (TPR) repeat protein
LLRATIYDEMDKYDAPTLHTINQFIRFLPGEPLGYIFRGITRMMTGQLDLSLADLEKAVELKPGLEMRGIIRLTLMLGEMEGLDFEAEADPLRLGSLTRHLESYEASLIHFDRAVEQNPEDPSGYYERGLTAYQMEEYEPAMADFSQAIELDPDYVEAYFWRGRASYRLDAYDQAMSDFSQVIELDPSYENLYFWRGRSHYKLDEYEPAIADFTQAVENNPVNEFSYYWRGRSHYKLDDYEPAIADLTKASLLDPDDPDNYYWLARAYYIGPEDYDRTIAAFTKALEAGYDNPEYAYRRRGNAHARLGDFEAAQADYRQAIEVDPDYDSAYNNLCWFGGLLGHAEEVLDACDTAVELDPKDGAYYDSRGLVRALTGDYAGAVEDFQRYLSWAEAEEEDTEEIARREAWIAALEAGDNPFDAATLEALLAE